MSRLHKQLQKSPRLAAAGSREAALGSTELWPGLLSAADTSPLPPTPLDRAPQDLVQPPGCLPQLAQDLAAAACAVSCCEQPCDSFLTPPAPLVCFFFFFFAVNLLFILEYALICDFSENHTIANLVGLSL